MQGRQAGQAGVRFWQFAKHTFVHCYNCEHNKSKQTLRHKTKLLSSGHIRSHQVTSGHNRSQQVTTGHIRAQQGTSGHNMAQQSTTGHNRAQQGTIGHNREHQGTTGHNMPQRSACHRPQHATTGNIRAPQAENEISKQKSNNKNTTRTNREKTKTRSNT